MGLPQGSEWIILAVVALVLFGGAKLANFGKNAGKAIREFKEEAEIGGKSASSTTSANPATPAVEAPPAAPAEPTTDQASSPTTDLR